MLSKKEEKKLAEADKNKLRNLRESSISIKNICVRKKNVKNLSFGRLSVF
jgi:hypothetical protein